uniref:Uncharacterized protein n=1 Tax=Acrobeloides nanus TaxID=290746 RepID=A0A914CL95_9BILA
MSERISNAISGYFVKRFQLGDMAVLVQRSQIR